MESGSLTIADNKTPADLHNLHKKAGVFNGRIFDHLNAEENLHSYRQLKGLLDPPDDCHNYKNHRKSNSCKYSPYLNA